MKNLWYTFLFAFLLVSCFNDPDDEFVEQCATPTNVQIVNVNIEDASISWEDDNNSGSYTIEYGISGFTQGSGTAITSTETTLNINNLMANTTYDVYIQSMCSTTNISMATEVSSFTTLAPLVVPQFLTNLSDLNLFSGDLANLTPSIYAFEYHLNSPLFTDYAHKQRLIALPNGTSMEYVDDGFPNFPDNTVISKTFYYNNDERDESLGRKIIETRILIKQNGDWVLGNYKWNDAQTEAVLDDTGSTVPVTFVDDDGSSKNINYEIPSATDCFTCHNNANVVTPIGPKLRTLNFNNQLQSLIDARALTNITDVSTVATLPNWEDDRAYSLEERARAYFDINCAHCHSPGGFCEALSTLDLRYETRFGDTNIFERRFSIRTRTQTTIENYGMPLIGTTILHDEGVALIEEFIDSL